MSDGREGGFQYRLALLEVEDKEILANTCAQESVLYAIHGTEEHELAEVILEILLPRFLYAWMAHNKREECQYILVVICASCDKSILEMSGLQLMLQTHAM